jgi:hypothetical protein
VTRGEIYRTSARAPERGGKRGFYVEISRAFIAENDDVANVVCAPAYSEVLAELNRALAVALDLPA